jgi:hypothetical protein
VSRHLEAAIRLHSYITNAHWNGQAIVGPDPIGKINWRVTRFIKSYLNWLPWSDNYVYLQGQGYWIRDNLHLGDLTDDDRYLDIARQCADYVVQMQLANGAWKYPPLWERRHLIATVEGVWASLGLVDAYRRLGKQTYLDAVLKWYDFQINVIGFQQLRDGLAINYYDKPTGMVPNNTTMLLWLMAEIHNITGDKLFPKYVDRMIRFLEYSQLENGELQYAYRARPHLLCYQYNSFQFLDLAYYYDLTQDGRVWQILSKMASYLASGITDRGSSKYDCFKEDPEVNYWTAALAAALYKAHQLGLGHFEAAGERAYGRLLSRQNPDGSFGFSERTYGFLTDQRSYPRQLAMILNHLLLRAGNTAAVQVE